MARQVSKGCFSGDESISRLSQKHFLSGHQNSRWKLLKVLVRWLISFGGVLGRHYFRTLTAMEWEERKANE